MSFFLTQFYRLMFPLLLIISTPASANAQISSTPLTAQPAESHTTLFQSIPAGQSQLNFTHTWNPKPEFEHELVSYPSGGGVAIADINHDNLPDIYLTGGPGGAKLYQNLGDFKFKDITQTAGLNDPALWGITPTFVDIDADKDLDLVVTNHLGPNRVYINDGQGKFTDQAEALNLNFSGASVAMVFADYDRDGDLDVYLLTNRHTPRVPVKGRYINVGGKKAIPPDLIEQVDILVKPNETIQVIRSGQYDKLYRNDDGRFTDVSKDAGIDGNHMGLSATWWDYNDDGYPDLYIANDLYGPDHLYHNNTDGTFTDVAPTALPHTPWFSMGADFGDINNDGMMDFLATDMAGTSHYKQKMAMGDMADSAWFLQWPTPRQYMRNAVYLNTGTHRFREAAKLTGLSSTNWTWAVRFADFDNDTHTDLFVANGMTRDWMNSDLKKTVGENPLDVWLTAPERKEANLAFKNTGQLKFKNVSKQWGLDHLGISFSAATADLNNDGNLDLVVNHFNEPVSLYRNTTSKGNRVILHLRSLSKNHFAFGTTVRAHAGAQQFIRYLTPTRGFMSSSQPIIHLGLGEHQKIDKLIIDWPDGTRQTLKDIPVNHAHTITQPKPDANTKPLTADQRNPTPKPLYQLAETQQTGLGARLREKPFDDFKRQPLLPYQHSQLGPGMALADVNNDGHADLYVGGAKDYPGWFYINNGKGKFEWYYDRALGADKKYEDMASLFFDADNDGDLDLYIVSGSVECDPGDALLQDRLYLNDGSGNFTRAAQALPKIHTSGSVVTAGDIDLDGDLDLFVGGRVIPGQYPLTPQSYLLLNDGKGNFTEASKTHAPALAKVGLVTGATFTHLNQDHHIDLVVATEWGPVKIFINQQGKLVDQTQQANLANHTGWWTSLTPADLDNDGDIDFVVGNHGMNTKYKADTKHPATLYYADFDNTGKPRLVEAKYEKDRLLPVRGKSCSTNAMPFLKTKFPTFHDFASSNLKQIYSPDKLKSAQTFQANTLASVIMLNDGNARFTVKPLPRITQISTARGIIVTDVNHDAKPDIVLAQNFFGPEPETGHNDGGVGQILINTGQANFSPLPPAHSGFIMPHDPRALVQLDLNNDLLPDFITAQNAGSLHTFLSNTTPPKDMFSLILKPTSKQPHTIGSVITITYNDARTTTHHIHAGTGYLSQSDPTLYLPDRTKVKQIKVRWADGKVQSYKPPQTQRVTLSPQP